LSRRIMDQIDLVLLTLRVLALVREDDFTPPAIARVRSGRGTR
jgi:hypothetical protein